jgi:hypothetical protein
MDPISLIVAALAAGVAAGAKDVAGGAIKDAYKGLKGLISRRLRTSKSPDATTVDPDTLLNAHEQRPETWKTPLEEALRAGGAADDPDLMAAAQRLVEMADPQGARQGKYRLDLRGAQGVQVGDHGTMTVNIAAPPSGPPRDDRTED